MITNRWKIFYSDGKGHIQELWYSYEVTSNFDSFETNKFLDFIKQSKFICLDRYFRKGNPKEELWINTSQIIKIEHSKDVYDIDSNYFNKHSMSEKKRKF